MSVDKEKIMKIGDIVKLTADSRRGRCDKPDHKTASIEVFYSDIKGGVRLDRELCGFRSWNVADLELVGRGER